jgi:hypothetical protein
MNCACETDEKGHVISGCGAHYEWIRKLQSTVSMEDNEILLKIRTERDRYKAALQKIEDYAHEDNCPNPGFQPCDCLEDVAKAALKG